MNRRNTRLGRLLLFIILAGSIISVSAGCGTTPGSVPPAGTAQADPTATPSPTTSPTPRPSPRAFAVANTDGQGAHLRHAPLGDRIKAWPEGTVLAAVGGDQIVDGNTWRNVRDPEGNEGWVLADYLVPHQLTPVPPPIETPAAAPLPTSAAASGTPATD